MPRKTKRRKIEAEKRRQSNISLSNQPEPKIVTAESNQKKALLHTKLTTPNSNLSAFIEKETSYNFKKDLIKSLSITIFLVLIQLGIYSATYMGVLDITSFIDIK